MWEEIKDWISAVFITALIVGGMAALLWAGSDAQLEYCKGHNCIHKHD